MPGKQATRLTRSVQSLEFDPDALDDLAWWVEHDRKQALRIVKIFQEISRTPFEGAGQPEQLKHGLTGCWSRRVNREHRIVYEVTESGKIRILACRFHY